MSWVTDVLILLNLEEVYHVDEEQDTCEYVESEALAGVNAWLREQGYGQLVKLDRHAFAAGERAMQAEVHGGAFNYLDIPAFVACVQQQRWRASAYVQLLLKDEQEQRFTVYEFSEGVLQTRR